MFGSNYNIFIIMIVIENNGQMKWRTASKVAPKYMIPSHISLGSALFHKIFIFRYRTIMPYGVICNTVRVLNSLHPDQDRQSVGPDLGPNCLQSLSADDRAA